MGLNFQKLALVFLILFSFAACRKQVASTPTTQLVQPAPPPPSAPAITLRANPVAVERGQPVALQWESKNASAVRIEPDLGAVQAQGGRLVNPSSSVTYVATATGAGGRATDTVRVTVNVAAAAAKPAVPNRPPDLTLAELFRRNVQTIYFDYDDSEIRPDQIPRINAAASWLRERRDVRFTIEGHCDDRGGEEYNLGLGDRRSNRVKEYLIQQGIDGARIGTITYGEARPGCSATAEDCYQRNRRAEFVFRPL